MRTVHVTPTLVRAAATRLGLVIALLAVAHVVRAQDSGQGTARAAGRCGTCHPDERVAFEASRHAGEDVHCVSCHGGNEQSLDEAGAHSGNFRGKLGRDQVPGLCASCHSDVKRMQPYDLPVDQFALYQTSGHGVRLRQGDTRVAVCTDCHGTHQILSSKDPASSTYVTNIPRTCGGCHGDSTLVRQRGIPDTYHQYMTSIHARALFDNGNLRAPTCVSCHGVHGATPPDVGDVNKICGRCHTAERRYFRAGPHEQAMAKKNLAECSSCHGDHAIQASVGDRLATSCRQCHAAGSPDAQLGAQLLSDYQGTLAQLDRASQMVERADRVPLQTDDYRARLEDARTYLREALTAAHSVQPEVMAGYSARARSVGAEVEEEIRAKLHNITVEKLVLLVFWFYVVVTIVILRRWRDRPDRA